MDGQSWAFQPHGSTSLIAPKREDWWNIDAMLLVAGIGQFLVLVPYPVTMRGQVNTKCSICSLFESCYKQKNKETGKFTVHYINSKHDESY